jgi:thiamine biosynthesis lipoprotein
MDTSTRSPVATDRFRAMGSACHVIVVGGPAAALASARDRIRDLDERWSRFRSTSEVTRLTEQAGTAVKVSAETRLLVERAIEAWRASGGAFDPTLLGAVLRAGYTRSLDLGPITARGTSTLLTGCTDIVVDGEEVCLPPGTGFDPGGVGKGLCADLVVDELLAAGAEGACVNMGGDLRVAGTAPDGRAWTVAVEHPWRRPPLALLGLDAGAVATSTTLRRAWSVDGQALHHLIDPATDQPSTSDLTLATVVTGEAWMAEVLAKTVLLRGRNRAFDVLDGNCEAIVVDHAGRISASPGIAAFLGGLPLPARVGAPAPGGAS